MLLLDAVVLIHEVVYPHVPSEIDSRQLRLHIDFLCQSFQILTALFGIE